MVRTERGAAGSDSHDDWCAGGASMSDEGSGQRGNCEGGRGQGGTKGRGKLSKEMQINFTCISSILFENISMYQLR